MTQQIDPLTGKPAVKAIRRAGVRMSNETQPVRILKSTHRLAKAVAAREQRTLAATIDRAVTAYDKASRKKGQS